MCCQTDRQSGGITFRQDDYYELILYLHAAPITSQLCLLNSKIQITSFLPISDDDDDNDDGDDDGW